MALLKKATEDTEILRFPERKICVSAKSAVFCVSAKSAVFSVDTCYYFCNL